MATESHNLSLTHLRYFAKTVETGSMSACAEELFVAQSAISTSISALEKALGIKLFHRHRSKGVTPTEEGRYFYSRVSVLLLDLKDAIESIHQTELQGEVKVGCFSTLAPFWIPSIIEKLNSDHPSLHTLISEYKAPELAQAILSRDLEAGISYNFTFDPRLSFTRISSAPLYIGLPTEHHLAKRASIHLEELATEPLILLNMGLSENYFLSIFETLSLTPSIKYKFGSYEAVRSMVARGHGYCLLNQKPTHGFTNEGLSIASMPLADDVGELEVGILTRRNEPVSRRAQAFLDACLAVANVS